MQAVQFDEAIERITTRDPRYDGDAYRFLREALDHTQKLAAKSKRDETRHVSPQQLLSGIRDFALQQFGPMALTVLNDWGVTGCGDLGEIVFNMIETGLLAKAAEDSRDDFKHGYDFEKAFREPFLPARIRSAAPELNQS